MVDRALKSKPNSPAYIDTKGWILYKMGNYKQACSLLKRALSMKPNDAVIMYHYGSCLLKAGSKKEARKYLERALKIVRENPDVESEEPGILEKIEGALKEIKTNESGRKE